MDSQSSRYSSHDPSSEERRLNHMIFPQHTQTNTFSMTKTDQLQYDTPRGDYLQANSLPVNPTRPDMDMLMQDIDISNFSLAGIHAFCSTQTGSNVNDDIAQLYLQPSDYQNTTAPSQLRSSSSMATSSTYLFDQTLKTPINQGLHSQVLNQGPHTTAPMQQDPEMGTFLWEPIANSLSSMNDGVIAGSMMGSGESSMLDRKKSSNARGFRRRKYHPRHAPNRKAPHSSASGGSKNGTPNLSKTPTIPRDNMKSRSMTDVEEKKDDHVDPEQALNLLKKSIETQPYSSISQREMAALIKKIEDVVLREKLYGSSSSDSGEVTISSTVSDSISNSENIEPDYSSDATSVSSTPRLTVDETPDAEATEIQTVHKMNCPHCGNKPNYYCSTPSCGYFAHTRGDAKRHEEGEKHYPQARYMCCECPLAHAQLDVNGNHICEFCNALCLNSGFLQAHYLHCADAKNLGKTFSRKDHFIQHLREEHNIFNDAQYVVTSRYPIVSNWPRQCSRCPKTFQTWEERMKHLAEHAEEDFHPRGFSKKPKDDDDDDDNDDHHGGGGGSQGKKVDRQIKATLPLQPNHAPTSFNNAPSSCDNYRSKIQGILSGASEQPVLSRKPSPALERYLNDEESPIPIPLGYQKCEIQDTQLVTHTLQGTEMRYQDHAASDGNNQPLHTTKKIPSPEIPLAAFQDMPDEDAGCIQSTCNNSLQEFKRAHRQLLTARTARETPLSPNMKLYPIYPIPILSDKQERALQLYVKYNKALEPAVEPKIEHTRCHLTPPITTTSVVKSTPVYHQMSTSISSSTFHGLTDLSSVISFDDRERFSFGKNSLGKLISFDGKTIKKRARERSRLIRWLGSCRVCTSRRISCRLEHHDIEALEGLPSHSSQLLSSQILGNSFDGAHYSLSSYGVIRISSHQSVPENVFKGVKRDARMREIFARNPDLSTIEAFTPTAQCSYVVALNDLCHKHLATESSIGVNVKSKIANLRPFNLDFHIPYYAAKDCLPTQTLLETIYSSYTAASDTDNDFLRRAIEMHVATLLLKSNLGLHIPYYAARTSSIGQIFANTCHSRSFMETLRSRACFKSDNGVEADLILSSLIRNLGTSTQQMTLELAKNLGPEIGFKFEISEWPHPNWINGVPNRGKPHLRGITLNGPWSNKEPTSRLLAEVMRCNHCLTKGHHDLLKPDRKVFQSMRGDDSVSAVLMETPHVQFKTTNNRIFAEHAEPDLSQTDFSGTHSKARSDLGLFTVDREWLDSVDNISDRVQELSHLVPMHRLEEEEVRKSLQNKSPFRPILAGLSNSPRGMSPTQATSGIASPEAQRATAGKITTCTTIEENNGAFNKENNKAFNKENNRAFNKENNKAFNKENNKAFNEENNKAFNKKNNKAFNKENNKAFNEENNRNCAVSRTRDLMWMLHLKLQQQEDPANVIADLGGTFPFEETEDESRMQTELVEVRFVKYIVANLETLTPVYETTTARK